MSTYIPRARAKDCINMFIVHVAATRECHDTYNQIILMITDSASVLEPQFQFLDGCTYPSNAVPVLNQSNDYI